jgi:phosphonopyruvate decarboxylase
MASRELFEARDRVGDTSSEQDFLTVGGMGHAISIATAIARQLAPHSVLCLDGDGAMLMHAGALLQSARQSNLIHVVLDNGVHDSVGGQVTHSQELEWESLARAFGYANFLETSTELELIAGLEQTRSLHGSFLIRARCGPGHRTDLGRPKESPVINGQNFSNFLSRLRWP